MDEWKIPSWIPDLPRPLIVVIWGLLLIWLAVGAYIESLNNPGQLWWRYLWQGGVGGNGYNAWLATLSLGFLTTEVIIMIFTLRSNQARVERAEKAATEAATKSATEAATKAAAAAMTKALSELQQAWESWNDRRIAAEQEGRPFTEPPPGHPSGTNGSNPA